MDQQGKKRIKELLSNGRELVNETDVMDAHRDCENWVRQVGKWLETWSSLAASAEWVALPHSRLVTPEGYHDYPDAWNVFYRTVQVRLVWLSKELSKIEASVKPEIPRAMASAASRKVFIVHGHDEVAREIVARFIQSLGLEPIILHERVNKGRTIITKFREEAADVAFAVVLMTPDDHGGKARAETRPRARQNVVFELGFFIGALGPERVSALVKGDVERPSDFDGVVYISMDHGHWKIDFAKELKAAGIEIDFNKVITG